MVYRDYAEKVTTLSFNVWLSLLTINLSAKQETTLGHYGLDKYSKRETAQDPAGRHCVIANYLCVHTLHSLCND